MPAPKGKNKKIVYIHGQHHALERFYTIAEFLNDYGEVYMPDMPGFGGMDSFYTIDKQPTYDAYADYLYTYLKSQKLTSDLYILASSFGSQVMTRMFQKYPESVSWVKVPVAFVGFASGSNFHVSRLYKAFILALAYPASTRLGVAIINAVGFNPISMRIFLWIFSFIKSKMQHEDPATKKEMVAMERMLWSVNDHRTHAATALLMFKGDLRRFSKQKISHTLHNIMTDNDQYFDNQEVKDAFLELYEGYEASNLDLHVHAPSMIASKQDVAEMMPLGVKHLLEA